MKILVIGAAYTGIGAALAIANTGNDIKVLDICEDGVKNTVDPLLWHETGDDSECAYPALLYNSEYEPNVDIIDKDHPIAADVIGQSQCSIRRKTRPRYPVGFERQGTVHCTI